MRVKIIRFKLFLNAWNFGTTLEHITKSKPMSKYLQVCDSINSLDIIECAVPEISEIQNGGINNSTVVRFKEFEDLYVCNS